MNIRVTKKGNVVADGVKYKAEVSEGVCDGCAFFRGCCDAIPCTPSERAGKGYALANSVVFVKKEKKQDEATS